jgi:hypothetical protein
MSFLISTIFNPLSIVYILSPTPLTPTSSITAPPILHSPYPSILGSPSLYLDVFPTICSSLFTLHILYPHYIYFPSFISLTLHSLLHLILMPLPLHKPAPTLYTAHPRGLSPTFRFTYPAFIAYFPYPSTYYIFWVLPLVYSASCSLPERPQFYTPTSQNPPFVSYPSLTLCSIKSIAGTLDLWAKRALSQVSPK